MVFEDPFYGYSFLLRAIVYVLVPLFAIWQLVRLRRALHVFQLEGYKRRRFLEWCLAHPRRALFLGRGRPKKPLVMTGRAWRILVLATGLSVLLVLAVPGAVHVWLGGWPLDIAAWVLVVGLVFLGAPWVLVGSDLLLVPVQRAINARYLRAATAKLARVSPEVVAITGSFGKTSTKFAVATLLGGADTVLATPGSFNTPLGVCRTINELLEPRHRYLVVEMGAYARGDIAELCRFVRPRIGVLTSIGPAHLERFGSLEAIAQAKREIVDTLPEDGFAVLNVDDPQVRRVAETTRVRVFRYGIDASGDPRITARDLRVSGAGTSLTIVDRHTGDAVTAATRLLGRHAIGHILAAAAVAVASGRRLPDLRDDIAVLEPVEHRLQLLDGSGGVTIIDDAYNSNPDGAAAALDVLEAMHGSPKVVVTPGMIELGDLQFDANERFAAHAARVADALIAVAPVNRTALVAGARKTGNATVITVESLAEAQEKLRSLLRPGAVVLFENDLPDQYER